MQPAIVAEALTVLNLTQHRGVRCWRYDPQTARVMPESWNMLEAAAPPCFTVFEARAVARQLLAIGAVSSTSLLHSAGAVLE